jgi:hypothetical protein
MVITGVGMAAFWAMLLLTRSVPEVEMGDKEIWFHIAAEYLTAAALAAAGVATIVAPEARWSAVVSAAAFGALVYTLIQSPGYYVERRNPPMVAMFAGFWAITLPAIVLRFV